MDPISALALITTVWGGIKKAVEVGREVQDVMGQLSQWAQAADSLEQAIQAADNNKKPPLFKKLTFGNDTQQAFDAYTARVKMREMEAEIRHEFLYGGLNHLGMDGLKEFYQMRRQIRERRIKMLQDQKIRRQQFIEMSIQIALASSIIGAGIFLIYIMIQLII